MQLHLVWNTHFYKYFFRVLWNWPKTFLFCFVFPKEAETVCRFPELGNWMHLEQVEKNGGGIKKTKQKTRACRQGSVTLSACRRVTGNQEWEDESGCLRRGEAERLDNSWISGNVSPCLSRGGCKDRRRGGGGGRCGVCLFFTSSAIYTYILSFLSFTSPVIHLCFPVCPKPNSSASSTQSTTRPSHAITESPLFFIFERPCSSPSRSPSPPPFALFTRRRSQTSH